MKDNMVKVSVVIPVYNVADYLPACVESLLNQTLQEWEAIFINDGSRDNSLSILEACAQKDSRIKVINQENQGVSAARNNGVKHAIGTYIYFLDLDDIIHPQLLEICYTTGEKKHVDIIYFDFQRFTDEKEIVVADYDLEQLDVCVGDKEQIKLQIMVWTKCCRRDFINGIMFIPTAIAEDLVYAAALLLRNPQIAYVKSSLYFYRKRVDSLAHRSIKVKTILDYHTALNALVDLFKGASQKDWDDAFHAFFPDILKKQLNGILRSPKSTRPELWYAFANELLDLKAKGLLGFRGHKIRRWVRYQLICWMAQRRKFVI
jgi:glycosyltransferase involved in cell wall biosynthesis